MTAHANEHLGQIEVDGHAVPRRNVPQCRTCSLPEQQRDQVEANLLSGRSPWAIIRDLGIPNLTERNITEHYARGHIAMPLALARERQKESQPVGLAEGVEKVLVQPLTAQMALLDAVVRDVTKRIGDGTAVPTVGEGIRAAEVLAKADEALMQDQLTEDDWFHAFDAVAQTVKRLLDGEQFARFQAEVGKHPVIREIKARQATAGSVS